MKGLSVKEVRDLTRQIQKPQLSYTPAQVRKGIVTAVNWDQSPVTIDVSLGGEIVPGVACAGSFTPSVGGAGDQVALLLQQGPALVAFDRIAPDYDDSDWQVASGSGITAGDGILYRMVLENGAKVVEFKGNASATAATLFTLPAAVGSLPSYRPTQARSMGIVLLANASPYVNFATNGVVSLVAGTGSLSFTHTVFFDNVKFHVTA